MALWELEEFQGPQFLGFVRTIPEPQEHLGQEILPNDTVFDLEVEMIRGARNTPVMASVITYDSEAPIGGKPGLGERIMLELPPIKRKERISEKEIIRFLTPRANTPDKQIAIDSVYDSATRLVQSVFSRVEWLRWQALSEPTLSYNEDDVIFALDYGFNPDLQINVDLDVGFSDGWDKTTTADVIADLQAIQETYESETGTLLATIWCSRRVINYILRNAAARDLIRGTGAATAQLAVQELNTLLELYQLPTFRTYDTKVWREELDGSKTELRPLDYHKAVGVPAVSVGRTLWGPTAESRGLFGTTLASVAPGVWANMYVGAEDPPTEWVKAAGISIPSIENAELVAQLTLLSSAV